MLLDTNILLDAALERHPHYGPASAILQRLTQQPGRGFVAWHTIATFYYLVARARGDAPARDFIRTMTDFLTVPPTGSDALRYALALPMRDFEDAMQVAAARTAGAQYIVTRNIRDFTRSAIPAIAPEQALRELPG